MHFPVYRGEHNISFEGVELIYYIKERDCHLLLIQTRDEDRGQGRARKVLEAFLAKMDMVPLPVYLVIDPQDSTTSEEGLAKFYSSVGFCPFEKPWTNWVYFPKEIRE